MDSSGNQSLSQDSKDPKDLREMERLKKRMIKLTNNTQFPYDAKSYDQTRWTYSSIIENYKDKAHIPPLELVYAGIKKTLTNIKKDSFCVRCAMKVGENGTRGLYFPLDKGIYLIPNPCCEGCFSRVPTVLVNSQICPIRHYTWKMIVCANLSEYYHRKIMVEAEKVIEKPIVEVYTQEEDPIINHLPVFTSYDFTTEVTSVEDIKLSSLYPPSDDYQWIDIQEEVHPTFDTHKIEIATATATATTTTKKSKIQTEWILSSILGPITCYIFYHLFHLFMHKNE